MQRSQRSRAAILTMRDVRYPEDPGGADPDANETCKGRTDVEADGCECSKDGKAGGPPYGVRPKAFAEERSGVGCDERAANSAEASADVEGNGRAAEARAEVEDRHDCEAGDKADLWRAVDAGQSRVALV